MVTYRFPDSVDTGPKKDRIPFEVGYGSEAREAFHQVSERFLPNAIDENMLISGAVQLLAQEQFDLAAEWMEDLSVYLENMEAALDTAGFAPKQHWRFMVGHRAQCFRDAAQALRNTPAGDVAEEWLAATTGPMTNPAVRREVVELVRRVDAEQEPYFLGAYNGEGVAVVVHGPDGRGTYCLPTRKAHAVARMLQEHPEMLVDRPAAPEKAKAAKKASRARAKVLRPRFTPPVWIRNARGHIVAGGVPLFPDFLEAK
jgi:hypothetical protein